MKKKSALLDHDNEHNTRPIVALIFHPYIVASQVHPKLNWMQRQACKYLKIEPVDKRFYYLSLSLPFHAFCPEVGDFLLSLDGNLWMCVRVPDCTGQTGRSINLKSYEPIIYNTLRGHLILLGKEDQIDFSEKAPRIPYTPIDNSHHSYGW